MAWVPVAAQAVGAAATIIQGVNEVRRSQINPTKPPVVDTSPIPMPGTSERDTRAARRRSVASQSARSGRVSTMLSYTPESLG